MRVGTRGRKAGGGESGWYWYLVKMLRKVYGDARQSSIKMRKNLCEAVVVPDAIAAGEYGGVAAKS